MAREPSSSEPLPHAAARLVASLSTSSPFVERGRRAAGHEEAAAAPRRCHQRACQLELAALETHRAAIAARRTVVGEHAGVDHDAARHAQRAGTQVGDQGAPTQHQLAAATPPPQAGTAELEAFEGEQPGSG